MLWTIKTKVSCESHSNKSYNVKEGNYKIGESNMEILMVLVIILVLFLVIRGAVHQGTLDALIEFEDYKNKKEKNKIE